RTVPHLHRHPRDRVERGLLQPDEGDDGDEAQIGGDGVGEGRIHVEEDIGTPRRVSRVSQTAWGYALVTRDANDAVLDAWFPAPALGRPDGSPAPAELEQMAGSDDLRAVSTAVELVEIADLSAAPAAAQDAWLRLHLLS